MKLTVEVKDGKFIYEMCIEGQREGGEIPVTFYALFLFNDLLKHLHKNIDNVRKNHQEAWNAYLYCKVHPEEIEDVKRVIESEAK